MKKLFVFLALLGSCLASAQDDKAITFGVKAGLNYGDNGKIEISDIADASGNIFRENADDRVGYHFGVFLRGRLGENLYIKPELQYTQNRSSYDVNNRKLDYDIKKLDLPVLLGVKVLGPIHVFGGPAFQYIVDNELEDVRLGDVKNEFTVGLQFGAGIQLGKLNVDIRYERGLNDNQSQAVDNITNTTVRVDSRPNQFIVSLGLDL